MQLRIVHTSQYEYDGRAVASHNQARMTPVTTPEQIVVHHRIDVSPKPWTASYTDYFGTQVTSFEVVDPHDTMTVTATSTVQVNRAGTPEPTTGWAAYDTAEIADRWTEYLVVSEAVAPPADLAARLEEIRAASALPGDAARAVVRLVHEEIEFLPGATDVESPAAAAWEQRAGVCQDMVHLAIGGLRMLGIPARYVSGYVHPVEEPVVGDKVAGDSRAWLEWWDDGWQGFDPSTDTAPNDRYVVIGHGRDYGDVPPLRGIYSGATTSELDVTVEITRLE
ncbi:transglutaminase family protein [Nocardioides caeni]|uniref:Transglutaminase family protein n=2 Tax=Nocardioides caeni TaxID=574700 RepID=A0A4S8NM26_9ACTN|nr:transglutaminase family protein [Nocardioides caeni]